MAASSITGFLKDAPWLNRRRLVAYPKLFLFVYVVSAVVWLMRGRGLIDPAGHPVGADFIDPWSASWLTIHGSPSAVYNIARLWSTALANMVMTALQLRRLRTGFNGRLDTLQAAILLAKLEVFEEELAARHKAAATYNELLKGVVQTPVVREGYTSPYAQYTIEVDDRDAVQKALQQSGVPTAVHYPVPLHLQPVFAYMNLGEGSFPHSERAGKRVLSLPMHPYLTTEQITQITQAVRQAVASTTPVTR